MKRELTCGTAIAGLLLSGFAAIAADDIDDATAPDDSRWYVSLFAGVALDKDPDLAVSIPGGTYSLTPNTNTGYVLGIAGGYRITPNLRGELEYSYTRQDFNTTTLAVNAPPLVASAPIPTPAGKTEIHTGLVNLWYDFDFGSIFRPYVGGGIGIAQSRIRFTAPASVSDTGFAYQLGAGVIFPVYKMVSVDLGYRFNGVEGLSDTFAGGGAVPFKWKLRTHSFRGAAVINF